MVSTQEGRLMAIDTPLGEDVLLLSGLSGNEGISQLFRFDLDLLSNTERIGFDDIVGRNVTVRLTLANGDDRYFNGFVSRFSQAGREHDLVMYRAEMVPWLWFLTRTSNCRIFQRKKVPDIVKQIFDEMSFTDYRIQLHGDFVEREYCVQYRETAFNFISRLLQEEGIFYFFEHEDGIHTLILSNDPAAHRSCPGQPRARYDVGSGGQRDADVILEWTAQQEIRPGIYTQSDYNFEQPNQQLKANVAGRSSFEIYDYHPGEFRRLPEGDSLVRTRLQELETPFLVGDGVSDCRAFTSGYRFELGEHYREDMNQEWVLTSIRHSARQAGDFRSGSSGGEVHYRNNFECIPYSTPFRPSRTTPHPVVQGSQTAVVVGPVGEEIFVDQYGRVKVQFHWDRNGGKNENSSCWIRVAQAWAGKGWGAIFVPRVGQEVVVDFLEGDPDQPLIIGCVYNASQTTPYGLPENKTRTALKSNSSKGGDGFNEFRFEDKKGAEQVFIRAERDMDLRVRNDEHKTVERDNHLTINRDRYEHIKKGSHLTVGGDHVQRIGSDGYLNVSGKQAVKVGGSHSFQVNGDVTEVFSQNHSEKTGMNLYVNAGMGVVVEAATGITLKCGSNSIVIDPAGVSITGQLIVLEGQKILINSGPGSPPASGSAGTAISPIDPKEPSESE